MIFVTFGTQDKKFLRPLIELEKLIKNGTIKERVVVQAGYTKYHSDSMEIFDYLDSIEFKKHINECDILITHGGIGSITDGLYYNKKIIAIPRLKKFNEHVNNHQLDIVNEFCKCGFLLKVLDIKKLGSVYKKIKTFVPIKLNHDNSKIINLIDDYINNN